MRHAGRASHSVVCTSWIGSKYSLTKGKYAIFAHPQAKTCIYNRHAIYKYLYRNSKELLYSKSLQFHSAKMPELRFTLGTDWSTRQILETCYFGADVSCMLSVLQSVEDNFGVKNNISLGRICTPNPYAVPFPCGIP